jgi:hypothetical protein
VVEPVTDLDLPEPRPGLDPPVDQERLERLNRELGIAPYSSRLLKALASD